MQPPCHARWLALPAALALLALGAGARAIAESPARRAATPGIALAPSTPFPYRLPLPFVVRDGLNPVAQDGFSTAATVTAAPGGIEITVTVTTKAPAEVLVQVEVYDALGARVHVHGEDRVVLATGRPRLLRTTWPAAGASPGPYSVRVGIFAPNEGWGTLYHWNHAAATFTLP